MTDSQLAPNWERGPIAWMTHNPVAANLLMLVLLVGGFMMTSQIQQEVFPEFDLDAVTVTVPYPGASPAEVEQGVILAVEEAVRGIDAITDIRSSAREHIGVVTLEVREGEDVQQVYQDVQRDIARINTFPLDAEAPSVAVATMPREVLTVQLYGEVGEWALREHAEAVRDRLLQARDISQVEFTGARNFEIQVTVPQYRLRGYNLSLNDVAERIRRNSIDVAGGAVDTASGEILLRLRERRDWAEQFADIPIVSSADGTVLRLGDIADVREGFVDSNNVATYNGQRSIGISVYRVGNQTPIQVAAETRRLLQEMERELPAAIDYAIHNDSSQIFQQRLQLLLKNAAIGLVLVMILLSLFLEARLAFWVTMGIPISFLGAFLLLPALDVTINMISMFAFIIALGIVVDDAIVAGENMYEHRQRGDSLVTAAIKGAREVAVPISFSILSNIAAFMPLLLVPGVMGKIFVVIPMVVITVFIISWIEALFVMPAHLAYVRGRPHTNRLSQALHRGQQAFSSGFNRFVAKVYAPFIDRAVRVRYVTAAAGVAVFILVLGYAASGRMGFVPMPTVESDFAVATVNMPYGSPLSEMEAARDRLERGARQVAADHGGERQLEGIYSQIRDNVITTMAYMTPPDDRVISTGSFTRQWRGHSGDLPGALSQQFQSDFGGPSAGPALTVELSHRDSTVLEQAALALAEQLEQFEQSRDIDPGTAQGKQQLDFSVTAAGRALGLSSEEIGRQVRAAFQGAEALRQQRGRNEVTVAVRLPEAERASEHDVMSLLIRTGSGQYVPLGEVARVESGRAFTEITRRDGRRTLQVTAGVEPREQAGQLTATLQSEMLPALMADFPGLNWRFAGQQADIGDSLGSLKLGFLGALLLIYVLMAIPFKSYLQPMIVMLAIPFGVVGAILGHLIMGYSLSIISMMGVVALSGVVVNSSLVLVHYANGLRDGGASALEAICQAGARRFRPILLTTFTTFGGLAPMIFETSLQARFMIPMAISLGFGILFASLITLILVPVFYMILEDIKGLFARTSATAAATAATPSRSAP